MKRALAMSTLAPMAEGQHGLVTTQQAARTGVSRLDLSRLEGEGDLRREVYGVYRMQGSNADEWTELRAYWLALDPVRTADERARDRSRMIAVSHRSAALIYGIGDLYADQHHYTSTYRKQSVRADVLMSQSPLEATDVRIEGGMLVTTVDRTLGDLARTEADLSHVSDALGDAVHSRLTTPSLVEPHMKAAVRRFQARSTGDLMDRMLLYRGLDTASLAASIALDPAMRSMVARLAEVAAVDALGKCGQELSVALSRCVAPQVSFDGLLGTTSVFADAMSKAVPNIDIMKTIEVPDLTAALQEALQGVNWDTLAAASLQIRPPSASETGDV